jgi:hypothetical protein
MSRKVAFCLDKPVAQRLYARLGFVPEDAGPVYVLMRWRPPAASRASVD